MLAEHLDALLGDPGVEHPLRDARFEPEGLRPAVVGTDPPVELARQPTDRLDAPGVGGAEPGGGEAPEVPPEHDEGDGPAVPRGSHGGRDTGGRAAVDADVGADLARRR
jgi:hypothetical protein